MSSHQTIDSKLSDDSPEKVKQAQYNMILRLYSSINHNTQEQNKMLDVQQQAKDAVERAIDELPDSSDEKARMKAESTYIHYLSSVLADLRANVWKLEMFEQDFRVEWKQKKKLSLEQRELFLKKKKKELDNDQDRFVVRLKKLQKDVTHQIDKKSREAGEAGNIAYD